VKYKLLIIQLILGSKMENTETLSMACTGNAKEGKYHCTVGLLFD